MAVRCLKKDIECVNVVIGCTHGCEYCYARIVNRRFRTTSDFSVPEFSPSKLRILDRLRPRILFLTGMSDLADWRPEWLSETMDAVRRNPQHRYMFLTKSPERVHIGDVPDTVCLGVTVTRDSEKDRISVLRRNTSAEHYHITFEPMFDRIRGVDFEGVDWIVLGTETGNRRNKAVSSEEWVFGLMDEADDAGVKVFMKEDLLPIVGEERMVQHLPDDYERQLALRDSWKKRSRQTVCARDRNCYP